jgi:peptidoglycan/xylan/chitin deacetylase (PgdA/CDA1 family)
MRFLRRHLCPIPLRQLVDTLRVGDTVDARWVAVVFDDGLKCQFVNAARVLAEFDIPWSLCVPAGLVNTQRSIWTYELALLFFRSEKYSSLPLPDGFERDCIGAHSLSRARLFKYVKQYLLERVSSEHRFEYVERLIDRHGRRDFEAQLQECGAFQMATWPELATLRDNGVELICHGYDHLPHNSTLSDARLVRETVASRELFHEQIGQSPEGFAIPGGIRDERSATAIKRAGYKYCLTSDTGRISRLTDLYSLPRIDAEYPLHILRNHIARARLLH